MTNLKSREERRLAKEKAKAERQAKAEKAAEEKQKLKAVKEKQRAQREAEAKRKEQAARDKTTVAQSPISDLVPKKGLKFFSDYTEIKDGIGSKGNSYRAILRLFANRQVTRGLPPMWGRLLFTSPIDLPEGVETTLIQSIEHMDEHILRDQRSKAESNVSTRVSMQSSSSAEQNKNNLLQRDVEQVFTDLDEGNSAYHNVLYKLIVDAPTLAKLDDALTAIKRYFQRQLNGGFSWLPYEGEQRAENQRMFDIVVNNVGKPINFTSAELAGAYNYVSHGISDPYGEYVGETYGELVNTAMLFDVNNYTHHVIVGSNEKATGTNPFDDDELPLNTRAAALWGKKMTQAAILDGNRVVSIVLDNSDVRHIGDDDSGYTSYIHANHGAVNPFEVFGDEGYESEAMNAHTEMLAQMAYQMDNTLLNYDLGKLLHDTINDFYTDRGFWLPDASARQAELKLLNRPHEEYPTLRLFLQYLTDRLNLAKKNNDQQDTQGYSRLLSAFSQLNDNGDLFDIHSDYQIDESEYAMSVVYDFRSLINRSSNIAMTQLINTFGYATRNLGSTPSHPNQSGDLLIIYGADELDLKNPRFVDFLKNQIHLLERRNVRIAWLYNNTDKMFEQAKLNKFDEADYILCSKLSANGIKKYENALGKKLPERFHNDVQDFDKNIAPFNGYLLHRKDINVLFESHLILSKDATMPRELYSSIQKAEESKSK